MLNAWSLRRLMPYTSITPGSTAMQETKNTMVTSCLHQHQGLGRQVNLQNRKLMSRTWPKTTCAMPRSTQLCPESHVIWMVCCHEARMEKLFQSRGCSRTPPPARAVPRPLPSDNRAEGKGYHKNSTRNTGWLRIHAVPGNCIQRTNTTSSYAPG